MNLDVLSHIAKFANDKHTIRCVLQAQPRLFPALKATTTLCELNLAHVANVHFKFEVVTDKKLRTRQLKRKLKADICCFYDRNSNIVASNDVINNKLGFLPPHDNYCSVCLERMGDGHYSIDINTNRSCDQVIESITTIDGAQKFLIQIFTRPDKKLDIIRALAGDNTKTVNLIRIHKYISVPYYTIPFETYDENSITLLLDTNQANKQIERLKFSLSNAKKYNANKYK